MRNLLLSQAPSFALLGIDGVEFNLRIKKENEY